MDLYKHIPIYVRSRAVFPLKISFLPVRFLRKINIREIYDFLFSFPLFCDP